MKRENLRSQCPKSSSTGSNRNRSSTHSRPTRVPIKSGTIIRNPIRQLSQDRTKEEQQAKQKIENLEYEKYGFGDPMNEDDKEKIENALTQCREFGRNPDRESTNWEQLWNDIKTIRTQQDLILAKKADQCFVQVLRGSSSSQFLQIKENSAIKVKNQEYNIWQGVCQLQEEMRSGDCFPGLSGLIEFKINQFQHSFQNMRTLMEKMGTNQKFTIRPQIEEMNHNYTKILVAKAFNLGISNFDIDQLSYFRLREFNEGHLKGSFKAVANLGEWIQSISKRRNKKRKAPRFLLHTACQTCLSPHSQDSNPIVTCPECNLRIHSLCLDLSGVDRCGRCIYSRFSKNIKQCIPECFICCQKNLTPIRINYGLFAHGFCLLANNLWTIKEGKLSMDEQAEFDITKGSQKQCDICKKKSKFIKKCDHCVKKFHPICAFLEGYSMKTTETNNLQIDCSNASMKQTRRYILNFEQMVFKRLNQMKKRKTNFPRRN